MHRRNRFFSRRPEAPLHHDQQIGEVKIIDFGLAWDSPAKPRAVSRHTLILMVARIRLKLRSVNDKDGYLQFSAPPCIDSNNATSFLPQCPQLGTSPPRFDNPTLICLCVQTAIRAPKNWPTRIHQCRLSAPASDPKALSTKSTAPRSPRRKIANPRPIWG